MPHRPQQTSPFLKLPIELRIMIYDLALQDVYPDLAKVQRDSKSILEDQPVMPLPFLGALAILHTCRELRDEGISALRSLLKAEAAKLAKASERFWDKRRVSKSRFTDEDSEEISVISDGRFGVRRLKRALEELAHGRTLFRLSQLRVEIPWSKLDYEQKRWEIRNWLRALTLEDRVSLRPSIRDCDDRVDALVRIVDSSAVEMKQ